MYTEESMKNKHSFVLILICVFCTFAFASCFGGFDDTEYAIVSENNTSERWQKKIEQLRSIFHFFNTPQTPKTPSFLTYLCKTTHYSY
jgi:hypothetical protein